MVFYKYVSAERIDILQNRLIRFTQPPALNDPFEAKPHFYKLGSKEEFAKNYAEAIRKYMYRVWVDYCRALGNDPGRFALAKKVENDPDYAEWLYKNLHKRDRKTFSLIYGKDFTNCTMTLASCRFPKHQIICSCGHTTLRDTLDLSLSWTVPTISSKETIPC